MTLLDGLIGKRRLFELLEIVDKRNGLFIAELVKVGTGWNEFTASRLLRLLVDKGLLTCATEGGLGEYTKKVYRLTPKGRRVLEHMREIEKLLGSTLGNK